MAIFTFMLYQAILSQLALYGRLKVFPGLHRWGLKLPSFLACSTMHLLGTGRK